MHKGSKRNIKSEKQIYEMCKKLMELLKIITILSIIL